jgi:DNA primase
MVDTSNVDVRAFYEQYVRIHGRKPSRNWRSGEYEYHGSCPWCGGTDRFIFCVPSGRYSCAIRSSGCGRHGRDAIDFLREYEGLSFFEACDTLEIDPGSEYVRVVATSQDTLDEPPALKWQERAGTVLHRARQYLWSPRGKIALDYLHTRGFTDETIRAAHLGYIPLTNDGKWFQDTCNVWGLSPDADGEASVWLPEGVVIPWYVNGSLWKLTVRRITGWKKGAAKYLPIAGSSEALYRADDIKPGLPVVLCESEFDALAGKHGYGRDDVIFVATGSTTRARRARWITRMNEASYVLVSFDDDEPDENGKRAGDIGAKHWTTVLDRGIRWLPWQHDINDMLLQGVDLSKWVELGRDVAKLRCQPNQKQVEPDKLCSTCLDANIVREALPDDYEGTMYCIVHHPAHQKAPMETPQQLVTLSDQARPSETSMLSDEQRYQQFMGIVQRIADASPGGCTTTSNPPGYTIEDRARELAVAQQQAQQPDFWAEIKARAQRPPVDAKGRLYYKPEVWEKKLEDIKNWHPDEKLYAHYPEGYEGYCKLHRHGSLESDPHCDEGRAA